MQTFLPRRTLSVLLAAAALSFSTGTWAHGNTHEESFSAAKHTLERYVYRDHRQTIYCRAAFDAKKNITLPAGFHTPKHEKRAHRVEWEHVVPAENFGRGFAAWRTGDALCISNGKHYKGRKCAEHVSREFRLMQADMYNLFPAIGAVNAIRSNYNFVAMGVNNRSTFGSCPMLIEDRKAQPPEYARGIIARSYLYMQGAYAQHFKMSPQQLKQMKAWSKAYPPDAWECERNKRIERLQGNKNPIVIEACRKAGF